MRLAALALALSFASSALAQSAGVTLSGKVQDAESKAPFPFLPIQLRSESDTTQVQGRLTNEAGEFSFTALKRGTYTLIVRSVGFAPIRQRVLVGELSQFLDLGALQMVKSVQSLSAVAVTASEDGVAAALDKKVFSVADNIAQSGGSVLSAMATVPGVTIAQGGKVEVRGSDKVLVLIDGKQTALTASGLENLPASSLERIELINNPSAKYDANASAGIINLVFKKEERQGLNGRVGLVGGLGALWEKRENLPTIRPQYTNTPKINPSLSLNYRKGPTNVFGQVDWLHSPTLNKNEFATRYYDDGTVIFQQVKRNRDTDYVTLNGGVDHAFSARNALTVSALVNQETIIDRGDNPYFQDSLQDRYRLWQFLEDEVKYTAYVNAVFTHQFAQPGHKLAFTSVYSFHREDEKYFFTNTVPSGTGTDSFALLSDEHIVDLNADYTRPLAQGRIEAGFKGRYRTIPVDMQFFPGLDTQIDSGAGGWADYREFIPAVYGTYVFESERIELEGGVRLESVHLDYEVNPDHNTYESDGYSYVRPFPNVRAAWKFDDRRKLSVFVNQRVDRPNEVDIRIFPKYDEPELIKVGNPALQPQYSTSAELGYKTSWSVGSFYAAAFHRIVDGTITRIATQVPGSVLLYNVFQNGGRSRSTGGEIVWQMSPTPGFTVTANASAYRKVVDAFDVVNQYPQPTPYSADRQEITSGNVKFDASFRMPREWQAQVTGVHLAPDLLPQGRTGSRFGLDMGLKKTVFRGRGELVVNATDLLNTMRIRRTIRGTDFRMESTDYLETQVVRVGYGWKF